MPSCNRFLSLQTAEFDVESDTTTSHSEYAPGSDWFKAYLRHLAEHSDILVQARHVFAFIGSIHLQSEDARAFDDVIFLTTTDTIVQIFEACLVA